MNFLNPQTVLAPERAPAANPDILIPEPLALAGESGMPAWATHALGLDPSAEATNFSDGFVVAFNSQNIGLPT